MKGWFAVYYREILILKRRFFRLIASMAVSPLLYIVTFGYAMGKKVTIDDHTYLEFLIPGLVAMSSMTQSFAISSEINIARFYWKIFEEFQSAPISSIAYVTGEVMAGVTRSILSVGLILLISSFFGVILSYNLAFWISVVLNSILFASLAVALAMLVKSHSDQAMLNNFIITPMAFLGGTFFPVDRLPAWAGGILSLLPLTHASRMIRKASFGGHVDLFSFLMMAFLGIALFFVAHKCVKIAKD